MAHTWPSATPARQSAPLNSYQVDLPLDALDEQGQLLDWVIGFAFDTLDARHLDVRIVPAPSTSLYAIAQCKSNDYRSYSEIAFPHD